MRDRVVINDNLTLVSTAAGPRYSCSCGHDLASGNENFKDGCTVAEHPVDAIGQDYRSFATTMMRKMCFREFFCPACGARLATEIARVGDGYLWDVLVRL
jgi:N-methylhydantoinase B